MSRFTAVYYRGSSPDSELFARDAGKLKDIYDGLFGLYTMHKAIIEDRELKNEIVCHKIALGPTTFQIAINGQVRGMSATYREFERIIERANDGVHIK